MEYYEKAKDLLDMEKKVRLNTNCLHSMARAIGKQLSGCSMLYIYGYVGCLCMHVCMISVL